MQEQKPKLVLLDVYDTLLDMRQVEKRVNDLMGSRRGYRLWFELFMEYCFVDNCIEQFNDFPSIAKATLQMTAPTFGRRVTDEDAEDLLVLLNHLPIHPGVQEGLSALNDMNLRIAALTNSPEGIVRQRMELTGLISYFEKVLSAEHVGKYKPWKDVYLWAAGVFNLSPDDVLFVSTHGWDLAGAANAGMKTAYLKQKEQMLYPPAPKPGMVCLNLQDLASQLTQWIQGQNTTQSANELLAGMPV